MLLVVVNEYMGRDRMGWGRKTSVLYYGGCLPETEREKISIGRREVSVEVLAKGHHQVSVGHNSVLLDQLVVFEHGLSLLGHPGKKDRLSVVLPESAAV